MKNLFLSILVALSCLPTRAQDTTLEAEKASYTNCKLINDAKYSGGQALELTDDNAKITFTYRAADKGKCNVYVGHDALYGAKVVNITVNGNTLSFEVKDKGEVNVGTFIMQQGDNTIVITPNWTWFRIDYIRIEANNTTIPFDISESPVDPAATPAAKEMYTFLYENFGQKTISGIMTGDMTTAKGNVTTHADVQAVYKVSGKYPALIGFDFMNATGLNGDQSYNKEYTNASMALAKDTYKRGGFPAFTWHWRDPSRTTDAFYTAECAVKISDAMNADGSWNTSSTLYKNIINDIDHVADFFLDMQKEGMACIFRPLHEASGGWFWWGREGAKPFISLYRLVFHEMVEVKGVHNLIWVWNAGDNDTEWNPGDNCYDIVSADIYNNDFDYSSNYASFDKLKTLTRGKKIIALSENGPIPDIDSEFDEDAVWSWWMPWYQTWNGLFVDKTSAAEWKKCMNDSRIITLNDRTAGWPTYTAILAPEAEIAASSSAIYDLQGRRLSRIPSRGLYIQNGKKHFVTP